MTSHKRTRNLKALRRVDLQQKALKISLNSTVLKLFSTSLLLFSTYATTFRLHAPLFCFYISLHQTKCTTKKHNQTQLACTRASCKGCLLYISFLSKGVASATVCQALPANANAIRSSGNYSLEPRMNLSTRSLATLSPEMVYRFSSHRHVLRFTILWFYRPFHSLLT